jgi:hypothetical protein
MLYIVYCVLAPDPFFYSSLRLSAIFRYAAFSICEETVNTEVMIKIADVMRKGVAVIGARVLKYESSIPTVKK